MSQENSVIQQKEEQGVTTFTALWYGKELRSDRPHLFGRVAFPAGIDFLSFASIEESGFIPKS